MGNIWINGRDDLLGFNPGFYKYWLLVMMSLTSDRALWRCCFIEITRGIQDHMMPLSFFRLTNFSKKKRLKDTTELRMGMERCRKVNQKKKQERGNFKRGQEKRREERKELGRRIEESKMILEMGMGMDDRTINQKKR